MASGSRPKKSFAQKAGRFFRNLTLTAAFAAAAGTGYNYLGTQDDIQATVTSVEPAPGGDIIHTDKGNFVNTPSWVYQKTPDDLSAIAGKLKPGNTVDIHVYGTHLTLAGHSPDDYGFFRNVTDARVISQPPPPVVAVAPVDATPAKPGVQKPANVLTVPAALVNNDGIDKEDVMLPEVNVSTADLNAVSTKAPRLARDLDILRRLPITGAPVYTMITDPKNKMQSALFPVPPKSASVESNYDFKKHARIGRGTGTSTTFHEYFHAMQDMTEGRNNMFTLTKKDAAVSDMLCEASAVAFELASRQEAESLGMKFYDPPVLTDTWVSGTTTYTETYSEKGPSTNPENIKAFKDAYHVSFTANVGLDEQARQTAALQAGGQAVVSRLMQGLDPDWNRTYQDLIVKNVNNNPRSFSGDDTDPDYPAHRDIVFNAQGNGLKSLNFVPDAYIGANAQPAIDAAFKALGFSIVPVTPVVPAPPPSAPRPGA